MYADLQRNRGRNSSRCGRQRISQVRNAGSCINKQYLKILLNSNIFLFFYRTLIYHVYFKDLINDDCQTAIYMELPSALYVNVDEVAELRRKGMVRALIILNN